MRHLSHTGNGRLIVGPGFAFGSLVIERMKRRHSTFSECLSRSTEEAYTADGTCVNRGHCYHVINRRPECAVGGARFENPDAPETIGRDLHSSLRIQSRTEELEAEEDPIKPDRTR